MPCPEGGTHDYNDQLVDGQKRSVCNKCGIVSPFLPMPNYGDLVLEMNNLRKMLEDICECQDSRDELINKARDILYEL